MVLKIIPHSILVLLKMPWSQKCGKSMVHFVIMNDYHIHIPMYLHGIPRPGIATVN